ncbi:MAG TPA: flippase activity-associated protein Agl23 [Verrucomicrobiae bacterium]
MANPPPKIRWAIFFTVALTALAVRLPQLGERPMHSDEAVNAYITGELLAGESFHYDPKDRHGPALFILAEPVAKLLGAKKFSDLTESQLRLTPVIAGTATVLLFGAGVEWFGFIPCLVAALLFAFAPLPVYYNRYFIHETLFVAATLGLVLSGGRALRKNSVWCAALAGFSAALLLACKETAVIHFFALAVATVTSRLLRSRSNAAPIAAQLKMFLTVAIVFTCVTILLFTWFGRNWSALGDLFRAIPSFITRAGGEGHEKPFWYYLGLLGGGWSGGIILGLAALGIVRALNSARHDFLVIYALLIAVIYSAIPYKTPWLALNLFLPFAILAGMAVEWIWFATRNFFVRATILICIFTLGFLIVHDTRQWVFKFPADEKNPYAYAHTGEDLLRLPVRLEELVRENKISNTRIAVVAADAWPLPWYLRKFSQVGYWQPGRETGAADFFITTTDVSGGLQGRLKDFRPEYFGSRPNVLLILWSPQTNVPSHE